MKVLSHCLLLQELRRCRMVLQALRDNAESRTVNGWSLVYLDNAKPKSMGDTAFRRCLAELSRRGLYRVVRCESRDGSAWGWVCGCWAK